MRTLLRLLSIALLAQLTFSSSSRAEWVRGGVRLAYPSSTSDNDVLPVNAFVESDGRIHVFMRPTISPCVYYGGVTYICPPFAAWRDQRLGVDGVLDPTFPVNGRDLPVSIRGEERGSSVVADGLDGYFLLGGEYSDVRHLRSDGTLSPILRSLGYGVQTVLGHDDAHGVFVGWASGSGGILHFTNQDSLILERTILEVYMDDTVSSVWDLIADGAGGVFVVFEVLHGTNVGSTSYHLRVQHIDADGNRDSAFPANGKTLATFAIADRPEYIGGLREPDGGILFAWVLPNGPVYAQRLMHDGSLAPGWVPGGMLLTGDATAGPKTRIVADGDSGLYAAWGGPRVTHLGGDGTIGPAFGASGLTMGAGGYNTTIAQDDAGGAWVSWSHVTSGPGFALTLDCNHIGPDGVTPGWPEDGVPIVGNGHLQWNAGVLDAPGGGAIVFWHDEDTSLPDWQYSPLALYATRIAPDGTTATRTSLVTAERDDGTVHLAWDVGDDVSVFAVERSMDGVAWNALDHLGADASHRVEFVDRSLDPSTRAAYRLTWTDELGALQSTEPAWVEASSASLRLAGFTPNPARAGAVVSYTLATDAPADLAVFSVAGRLVHSQRLTRPAPGPGSVSLAGLAPGVYVVRLRQGALERTARGVVLP